MTLEWLSQAFIVLFLPILLLIVAYSVGWKRGGPAGGKSRGGQCVDPEYSARYYAAYIGETARLAGLDPEKFLANADLRDGDQVLKLAMSAEQKLLLKIIENLSDEDWERVLAQLEPLDQYNNVRQGSFEERRRDASARTKRDLAMTILKKINPVIQQVAGSWVGKVTGSGS